MNRPTGRPKPQIGVSITLLGRRLQDDPSDTDTILTAMETTYTDAGTPVLDMSESEYHDFLDREVRARIGLSLDEFVRQVNAGEIDWDDPEAFSLAGLVGVGEGGLIQPASRKGHRQPA